MTQRLRYFSTFTGIGGAELGLHIAYERIQNADRSAKRGGKEDPARAKGQRLQSKKGEGAGATHGRAGAGTADVAYQGPLCAGYSEIDRFATQIYSHHYPNHTNYGDITKINAEKLPDFDVLVGGFPCQAFSIAGKRRGFEDTRGTLFYDLARILRAKRPRLFVFENVKGLLSHDGGETFRTIIATLGDLGYDLQWQVLNSKNHGVPQNRERVYIVGHLRGTRRPEVFPLGGDDQEHPEESNIEGCASTLTGRNASGTNRRGNYVVGTLRDRKGEAPIRVMRDGISRARQDGSGQPVIIARNQRGEIREMPISGALAASRSSKQFSYVVQRGRVGKGIAQTLDTGMQQHTLTPDMQIRRLTPIECERLQGFPDDWTKLGRWDGNGGVLVTGISDTQRYKTLGNAMTVNVVADIMTKILQSL
jgi:DNA (cytosine-5)-methyltransferase 1